MLRKYLIDHGTHNEIIKSNIQIKDGILVPKRLEEDPEEALQVEQILDEETGKMIPTVTVNEVKKQQILDQRLQDQLDAEAKKEQKRKEVLDRRAKVESINLATVDVNKLRAAILELKSIVLDHDKNIHSDID